MTTAVGAGEIKREISTADWPVGDLSDLGNPLPCLARHPVSVQLPMPRKWLEHTMAASVVDRGAK